VINVKTSYRVFIAGIAVVAAVATFAGTVAAQTVVSGTGNPDIDIAAVQDAVDRAGVDRGGSVVLRGRFNFGNPPGRRGAMPDLMAMVLVSKEVTISGTWDEHGEMTTIEGGEIPFAIEARGARVRIERLRFVRPKHFAILVDAVNGLTIEACIIEDVQPAPHAGNPAGISYGSGIFVSTLMGLPNPDWRGNPGNVGGTVSILDNQISVNATADYGMGIMVATVGDAETPVDVNISGNTVRNTTLKGINVMQIGGRARVERNTVTSSVVYTGMARGVISGIHCGGSGSYVIARNRIDVADPSAAGIRVRGYRGLATAVENATITDNDVTLSAPMGAATGAPSPGIEIMGLARGNIVQRNRIRGAGVEVSVGPDNFGEPEGRQK
jgi:hypothetical protein